MRACVRAWRTHTHPAPNPPPTPIPAHKTHKHRCFSIEYRESTSATHDQEAIRFLHLCAQTHKQYSMWRRGLEALLAQLPLQGSQRETALLLYALLSHLVLQALPRACVHMFVMCEWGSGGGCVTEVSHLVTKVSHLVTEVSHL